MVLHVILKHFFMYLIVVFGYTEVLAPDFNKEDLNYATKTVGESAGNTSYGISTKLLNSRSELVDVSNIALDSTKITEQRAIKNSHLSMQDLTHVSHSERSRMIIESLDTNHSLRDKRLISCELPDEMVQEMSAVYRILNTTMYVGGNLTQSFTHTVDGEDSKYCPPRSQSLLYPPCPAYHSSVYLGRKAVPSYIPVSKCRCERCLKYRDMDCENIYESVSYYEHVECTNGMAVMSKKFITVNIGCVCAIDGT